MTSTRYAERFRSRARIGADAARTWVREINLRNPYAKAILMAIANYMNEDGVAWPGLATLSRDTDIGEDTIASRLRWCEEIGAIVVFKTWLDENGRRNHDRRGRPTSSEIRFCFDADIDGIEGAADASRADRPLRGAAAKSHASIGPGERLETEPSDSDDSTISTRCGRGQTDEALPPVSTRLAPDQPPPGAVRILNSESEDSPPNPPSGGGAATIDQDLENDIAAFSANYPAPITNLPRLRTQLTAMTKTERASVLIAVKGYAEFIADCERKKKPRGVKDADRWLANGMWQGYLLAGERAATMAKATEVAADSEAGRALTVLHRIARMAAPFGCNGKLFLPTPLSPQGLALAHAPPESEWQLIAAESVHQVRAWDDLIARELTGKIRPQLVHDRNRGSARGFMAPWPWPPRKDGSLSHGPPEAVSQLSDEDIRDFK